MTPAKTHSRTIPPQVPVDNVPNQKHVIGVCAMKAKATSKPMESILNRLVAYNEIDVVTFDEEVILTKDVHSWPHCHTLISFFSTGFPLDKAESYARLKKPFCINDLTMQRLLWDRRLVLALLDAIGVPTPPRIIVNRDRCKVDPSVIEKIKIATGVEIDLDSFCEIGNNHVEIVDEDTVRIGGQILKKPFVEKPVDADDHNVYIYYSKEMGGGGRRLFRKVNNKSSDFDQTLTTPRTSGSYIYEAYLPPDNSSDVKVYTVGPGYAHAEARKSPTVDGRVDRCKDGKEVRYVTQLTEEEKEISGRIVKIFAQWICGFDLLRVKEKSYVIDVNGWSFVKGSENYYEDCARLIRNLVLERGMKDELQNCNDKCTADAADEADALTKNDTVEDSDTLIEQDTSLAERSNLSYAFVLSPISNFIHIITTNGVSSLLLQAKQSLSTVLNFTIEAVKRRYDYVIKVIQLDAFISKWATTVDSAATQNDETTEVMPFENSVNHDERESFASHKVENVESVENAEMNVHTRTSSCWDECFEIAFKRDQNDASWEEEDEGSHGQESIADNSDDDDRSVDSRDSADHDVSRADDITGSSNDEYCEHSRFEMYESQISEISHQKSPHITYSDHDYQHYDNCPIINKSWG
ncbi:10742_t:CDS:2 [Paraglomus occultum]|uniref:Inositol hexakisphosphate and diphosphoinositol-pentakisphosphate kinase n=1 Tax=Paraglomus occultum TaxID=144539 RepID=A0A9N8VKS7_9GLOM|nr:10742_t:CDS:2 [Paraglomus occultum]